MPPHAGVFRVDFEGRFLPKSVGVGRGGYTQQHALARNEGVRCSRPMMRSSRADASVNMLLSLVSIVSFQPVPRAAPATARAARTAISMQLPDFGKSLQGMMPGGGGDDSGLSKEQAEEMEARMKTGGMTFDDFLMQTKVMQKAGAPLAVESGPHHAAGLPCEGCLPRLATGSTAAWPGESHILLLASSPSL